MFMQPMLLIEEVEQVPYSLCKHEGTEVSLATWTGFLEDLTSAMTASLPLSHDNMQYLVIWARMVNGEAGWCGPHRLSRYQMAACEVQIPTDWHLLGHRDRESLEAYIQTCMDGPAESPIPKAPLEESVRVKAPNPPEREVNIPRTVAEGMYSGFRNAISKIHNKALLAKIKDYNEYRMARLPPFTSAYETRCTSCNKLEAVVRCKLRKCGKCKVPQYCGVECQKAHWKKEHKEECAKFTEVIAIKIPDSLAQKLKKHRSETLQVLGHA